MSPISVKTCLRRLNDLTGAIPPQMAVELCKVIMDRYPTFTEKDVWRGCEAALNREIKLTGQTVLWGMEEVRKENAKREREERVRKAQKELQRSIEETPRSKPDQEKLNNLYNKLVDSKRAFRESENEEVESDGEQRKNQTRGFEWK